jgi:ankyrin repeat protein
MSERIFEAFAIVSLNGFGKDIRTSAYLNKSTYEDPYFLNTLGDNAYGLLKGAAAVEDTSRMEWILNNGRMPKLNIGGLIKWCIDKRFQNSAIWLMERFDLPQNYVIWNVPNLSFFYPLTLASRTSQTKLAMWLLDRGVNPNAHDYFHTPLFEAVTTRNLEMFKMLVERGADVNYEDGEGFTAPCLAVMHSVHEIFDYCLAQGFYDDSITRKYMYINNKNVMRWANIRSNEYALANLIERQQSLMCE